MEIISKDNDIVREKRKYLMHSSLRIRSILDAILLKRNSLKTMKRAGIGPENTVFSDEVHV